MLQAAGLSLMKLGSRGQTGVAGACAKASPHGPRTRRIRLIDDAIKEIRGVDSTALAEPHQGLQGADRETGSRKSPRWALVLGTSTTSASPSWSMRQRTVPRWRFAHAAIMAIKAIGVRAKAAIPKLIELLSDEALDGPSESLGIRFMNLVRDALASIGADAAPTLSDVLKDETKKPEVRYKALQALGRMGRKAKAARPGGSRQDSRIRKPRAPWNRLARTSWPGAKWPRPCRSSRMGSEK